jgi:hypothetical protein
MSDQIKRAAELMISEGVLDTIKGAYIVESKDTVTIHHPGHRLHGKSASVFFRHPDGAVNSQVTNSSRKGDVTNLTLKPGQFKESAE